MLFFLERDNDTLALIIVEINVCVNECRFICLFKASGRVSGFLCMCVCVCVFWGWGCLLHSQSLIDIPIQAAI